MGREKAQGGEDGGAAEVDLEDAVVRVEMPRHVSDWW